ncbi:hypothetical protein [Microbacterium sp. JZ31]|uniref:hypothetical protein n=1 Tax=Microbacterium sp. JZ31 TaxID=1906274 RepID=UPI0019329AE7|nr:hypothetical protein [Microbacterium sp. JZ31]
MGEQPRRRHSPAVYRRRRIAVLLLALIVIAGIVWLVVAQPWRALAGMLAAPAPSPTASETAAAPSDSATPPPSASPSPTPSSTEPAKPQPCDPTVIDLVPVVHGETFETKPVTLSIRLTNTGSVDCTLDVGTSKQRFVITSGQDTWWRSTDCQSEPSDMIVTLAAGQTVESAEPLTWDQTRSDVSTCGNENRPRAPRGGAAYHLHVEVGEVKAEQTAQFFLR